MALANLAYKIYATHEYPVLYINHADSTFDRHSSNFRALDILLQLLENDGAKNVLIVWDNSKSFNQSRDSQTLYTNLKNRGRRVVLVCSSYNIKSSSKNMFHTINANIKISSDERNNFRNILFEKAKIPHDVFDLWENKLVDETHFLALLYHVFYDDIGDIITSGVQNEIEENTNKFEKHLKEKQLVQAESHPLTLLGSALFAVGLKPNLFSHEDKYDNIYDGFTEKIKTFLRIVAIFSQYNS